MSNENDIEIVIKEVLQFTVNDPCGGYTETDVKIVKFNNHTRDVSIIHNQTELSFSREQLYKILDFIKPE